MKNQTSRYGFITATMAVALCPLSAQAAEVAKTAVAVSYPQVMQMTIGLVIVLGLIYFGSYFLRRINHGGKWGLNQSVKVISVTALSVREKVVLLEAQGQHILIGLAPGCVRTLHVFEKNQKPSSVKDETDQTHFSQYLKGVLQSGEGK